MLVKDPVRVNESSLIVTKLVGSWVLKLGLYILVEVSLRWVGYGCGITYPGYPESVLSLWKGIWRLYRYAGIYVSLTWHVKILDVGSRAGKFLLLFKMQHERIIFRPHATSFANFRTETGFQIVAIRTGLSLNFAFFHDLINVNFFHRLAWNSKWKRVGLGENLALAIYITRSVNLVTAAVSQRVKSTLTWGKPFSLTSSCFPTEHLGFLISKSVGVGLRTGKSAWLIEGEHGFCCAIVCGMCANDVCHFSWF